MAQTYLWVGIIRLEVQLVFNCQTFLFHRGLVGVAMAVLTDSSKAGQWRGEALIILIGTGLFKQIWIFVCVCSSS